MTTSDQTQPTETPNLPQPGPLSWLRFSLFWLVTCGLAYPLVTTLTAGTLFPAQANGSLISRSGKIVGSALIGQSFSGDQYFIGRPSASGAGYDPVNASGSNLASSNPALRERVAATSAEIAAREGVPASQIPADLVTASGGGLDPHVSPAGAAIQVARVARVRGISATRVRELIAANTQSGVLGLGQPGVNVLQLNLALDAAQ